MRGMNGVGESLRESAVFNFDGAVTMVIDDSPFSLELTAQALLGFGMKVRHPDGLENDRLYSPYFVRDVKDLTAAWIPLTVAINAVNRSMGQPDLYPFVLSEPVVRKLQFVCDVVADARSG